MNQRLGSREGQPKRAGWEDWRIPWCDRPWRRWGYTRWSERRPVRSRCSQSSPECCPPSRWSSSRCRSPSVQPSSPHCPPRSDSSLSNQKHWHCQSTTTDNSLSNQKYWHLSNQQHWQLPIKVQTTDSSLSNQKYWQHTVKVQPLTYYCQIKNTDSLLLYTTIDSSLSK